MPIIRDTEIEQLMRDYATPILKAAGLAKQNIKVVVLNDRAFNAFVMDGRHIFINAGALFQAKTPNEIIGVFAHETGHLADGHLMRLREKLAQAQTQSIIALLLGIGAVVAGAARRGDVGQIGAAAIMAPQSAIQRSLLAYARTQEDQADHAGVKFLNLTHQSARGMLELFKRLSNEMLFSSRKADPYLQTHPMPPERVATLERLAKASPYWNVKDPPAIATAPRSDARQTVRLPGTGRHRARRYPRERPEPAGALCPRHLRLPPFRPAAGRRADRRADPQRAEQSLFPRAQGPGAARRRPCRPRRSRRCAARCSFRMARR